MQGYFLSIHYPTEIDCLVCERARTRQRVWETAAYLNLSSNTNHSRQRILKTIQWNFKRGENDELMTMFKSAQVWKYEWPEFEPIFWPSAGSNPAWRRPSSGTFDRRRPRRRRRRPTKVVLRRERRKRVWGARCEAAIESRPSSISGIGVPEFSSSCDGRWGHFGSPMAKL